MSARLIQTNGGMHVNTRMHRATFVDFEDEYCAQEGLKIAARDAANAAADAPDLFGPVHRSRVFKEDPRDTWALGWHHFLWALGVVLASLILGFAIYKGANRKPAPVITPSGVITLASPERGAA